MKDIEMKNLVRLYRFRGNRDGATGIEYALIAALISVVIIAAVTTVGTQLSGTFNFVGSSIGSATN
jgi:pilus assembly protein Flp/PilA